MDIALHRYLNSSEYLQLRYNTYTDIIRGIVFSDNEDNIKYYTRTVRKRKYYKRKLNELNIAPEQHYQEDLPFDYGYSNSEVIYDALPKSEPIATTQENFLSHEFTIVRAL